MKTLSVPLSIEAMHRLDLDECLPGDLEELLISDETLYELFRSGVFDTINITLEKSIDDYEDECISGQRDLMTTLQILDSVSQNTESEAIEKLKKLTALAIEMDTGIFFHF
ncbi:MULTISPECIES: hypothetical protein [unclassified Pseudomonas]|uniref:hypothetical protein n=1 Tax=unclassified Pseudomonas TaxID=196821 RepID=UPI00111BDDF1|nr:MULTISPECIES: hypothetical protein [unclassified Pseudomonas]